MFFFFLVFYFPILSFFSEFPARFDYAAHIYSSRTCSSCSSGLRLGRLTVPDESGLTGPRCLGRSGLSCFHSVSISVQFFMLTAEKIVLEMDFLKKLSSP